MANQRVINGKNTLERLHEEFQKLLASQERITVVEFALRVGIAYGTLTHKYKDWAEKVRALRDEGRSKPRRKSPVTQSHDHIMELEEALAVITKLRSRIDDLSRQLSLFHEADHDSQKWGLQNKRLIEENERLRGVIISLQQEIERLMSPELSNQLLSMIEEHAMRQLS